MTGEVVPRLCISACGVGVGAAFPGRELENRTGREQSIEEGTGALALESGTMGFKIQGQQATQLAARRKRHGGHELISSSRKARYYNDRRRRKLRAQLHEEDPQLPLDVPLLGRIELPMPGHPDEERNPALPACQSARPSRPGGPPTQ